MRVIWNEPSYIETEDIVPATLSEAALHGLPGAIVRTIEPHTESHPVAILLQVLAMYGNVIGPGPHFRAEADIHPARLFVVLVGQTSKGRKGVALGHVKRLFEPLQPVWTANCIKSGLSSGEGLIYAVRDATPNDPGVIDKRLMVVESEFALAVKMAGRDGNILTATIRQAWETGNLHILNKNSPTQATGAHISIIGHIAREELIRYMETTEMANGFANRFLWAGVRRMKTLPEGGNIAAEALATLREKLKEAIAFAANVGLMERDDDARTLWAEIYPELSEGAPGLAGAVTSRAEAQVIRLAMLYALMDGSSCIRREHLSAGLALWDYCEESAGLIFAGRVGDVVAQKILDALSREPAGLTRTDIRDLFNRNQSKDRLDRTLSDLQQKGHIRVQAEQTEGRPTERWFFKSS